MLLACGCIGLGVAIVIGLMAQRWWLGLPAGAVMVFVPIFVLMLLGIILTELAKRAEAYFAPWKATTE